ncbi:sacsin N-terminal ATP-binding-like domain-containing protein [Mucilaginibacter agri]|uniref:Sacsin/Nov domain-containing protein n=1 Tax=Mucilaginibacter agri TaxID=2695265 RepID=A0A966DSE1_9SPHI|nr:hypothetical protein [Mucilaginibacter agri]NCD70028.1 hypothetical protein [Mucilaginibacter agri]
MEQKNWFAALTAKRQNTVEALKLTGLKTFTNHIISTYHEPAHFIYELIQNADDAKATKARLELRKNGVLFSHNGSVSFSLTDPALEREPEVSPGHINAITAFALSPKKDDITNNIGRAGVGFKSVFQYTRTPHIYNPPYCFKIEQFVIPREVKPEPEFLHHAETTAFWLPFDRDDKSAEDCYEAIDEQLTRFKNPMLFLKSLRTIDVITVTDYNRFTKELEEIITSPPVSYIKTARVKLNNDTLIKFTQKVKIVDQTSKAYFLTIGVAFVLGINNQIAIGPEHDHYYRYAWCSLPTRHETRLNYAVNAPFILSPNREALKNNRTENTQLINALALLMEMALKSLKEMEYLDESFNDSLPDLKYITTGFMPIAKAAIKVFNMVM